MSSLWRPLFCLREIMVIYVQECSPLHFQEPQISVSCFSKFNFKHKISRSSMHLQLQQLSSALLQVLSNVLRVLGKMVKQHFPTMHLSRGTISQQHLNQKSLKPMNDYKSIIDTAAKEECHSFSSEDTTFDFIAAIVAKSLLQQRFLISNKKISMYTELFQNVKSSCCKNTNK